MLAVGKASYNLVSGSSESYLVTVDSFTDKAVEVVSQVSPDTINICVARFQDKDNFYFNKTYSGASAADHKLSKKYAGLVTDLLTEAVDLSPGYQYRWKISCSGNVLKVYRNSTYLSTTDTTFSSGKFGFACLASLADARDNRALLFPLVTGYLRTAGSPIPKALGIYEVPIIGSGKPEDPFRPQLSEYIEIPSSTELDGYEEELRNAIKCNRDGKVNRIAVSWSALIPTDPLTGTPLNKTCIVRVFEQPDRQPHLWKLDEALAKIETTPNIIKLDINQAKKRALEMDKRLRDNDLEEW